MAEKVKLRDYQKSILDRLDVVRTDAAGVAESFLGVEIGGNNVLVDLLDISETLVVTEIQPVPLVKPWFLGMSNVRGVLYAINDLGQLINNNYSDITSNTRILLINDSISSNSGILVDKLIGLRQLEMFNQRDEQLEESICFKSHTYEDDEKKIWYVLDCEKFINSKPLETPYIT